MAKFLSKVFNSTTNLVRQISTMLGFRSEGPSKPHMKVAIVGGGICGLIFAIGLLERDVDFHIYEASPFFTEYVHHFSFLPAVSGYSVHKLQLLRLARQILNLRFRFLSIFRSLY